jgi:hypothetical protein
VSGVGSFAWAGRHIVAIAAAPMPATVVRSGIRRVMAAPTPAA